MSGTLGRVRRVRREPRWSNHVDVPDPIRSERRLTGEHWWDRDRITHMDDEPKFCPNCGQGLDVPGSIAVEYWESDRRVYHTNCAHCSWSGDIARVVRMVGPEPPH